VILHEKLSREVLATSSSLPTRAALLLVTQSRIALDVRRDATAADHALTRATTVAPDARFVANTRRWLAERRGRAADAQAAARAELPLVGDAREKTSLLLQIAAIEDTAGNDLSAMAALSEAVTLEPRNLSAWEMLAGLYLKRKQWAEAAAAWEAMAAATEDTQLRAALHAAIGGVREVYLDDLEGAQVSFKRALEQDPTNAAAQGALEAILLRRRAWGEYARLMTTEGDQATDARTARECYERAGDVHAECIGDWQLAAACFERAASMAPQEISPLEKLAFALESWGRSEDLPAVYERQLALLTDPVQQASVLVRLGWLYEARLGKMEEALKLYKRALDAAPTFAPATHSVLAVCRLLGRWEDVAALELMEAERIAAAGTRAARYVAVAEIAESALSKVDEAVALYERALSLEPSSTAAYDALDRIYRARGQWDALISLHEKLLANAKDPKRLRATSLELATLYHDRAGQPARAAELLRGALGDAGDHFSTLVALARALADAGKWVEYVDVLEEEARLLSDETEIVATLCRIGAAIEVRLKDPKRAIAAFARVLERAPKHEAALRAVARIFESEGHWEGVIAAERRLLELAPRPEDAAATLHRIGQLAEERIGQLDDAMSAYEAALERSPTYVPAATALERLLRTTGAHARLAQVLERVADGLPLTERDAPVKARTLARAAAVLELQINDTDRATAMYTKALKAVPDLDSALWGIVRLRETRRDWPFLDQALEALRDKTTNPSSRVRVLVRLARLNELRLGRLPRAVAFYEEALATGMTPAPLHVDRLRVARIEGKREAILQWLGALASVTGDPAASFGMLVVRALMFEYGASAHAEAASVYAAALALRPRDVHALDGYARCLARSDPESQIAVPIRVRALVTKDAPTRALLLFLAGALLESSGKAAEADAVYAEALEVDPDFVPALDGAWRARVSAGNWANVAKIARRAASAFADAQNAAEAWLEAGDICSEKLNAKGEALADYRSLLASQPGHARALERALTLFEAMEDWKGMTDALVAHIEAVNDPATRARHLMNRGSILATRLGKTAEAIADLDRAVKMRPDDPMLLGALARLHEHAKNWQDAAQLYERLFRKTPDAAGRRDAMVAQARIWSDELYDYPRAHAILEDAARIDPNERETLLKLAEVAALAGNGARAHDLFHQLASSGSASERVRALLALAVVKRTRLNDTKAADATHAQAFDLAVADPSALGPLEELASQNGDWKLFVTLGEAAVSRAQPKSAGILALRTSLARAYREKLRQNESADRHLSAALQSFPQSHETRLALAHGLMERNDDAAIAELRNVIEADPTMMGAYSALMTICARTGYPGVAGILASAVAMLGGGGGEIDRALQGVAALRPFAASLGPDESLTILVGQPRAWFLRSILAVIDPFLHEVFPGGAEAAKALSLVPDAYPLVADIRRIQDALGVESLVLLRGASREATLLLTWPRTLVLGSQFLTDAGRSLGLFHAASACARVAGRASIGKGVTPEKGFTMIEAITSQSDSPELKEVRKRVDRALPRKVRKELEQVLNAGGDARREWAVWDDEERKRALYTGILACHDMREIAHVIAPEVVVAEGVTERRRAALASGPLREALKFIVSDACWTAHRRLYGRG
jgi:tetratricopeptide (TPR) repeat protein